MAFWLVKSDPEDYSAADLERDGRTVWDGVRNALAQRHLRGMRPGDGVLVYHTGAERAVVARATVVGVPREAADGSGATVELEFAGWLPRPVPLAEIKADPALAGLALVRQGRLSVMPVTAEEWRRLTGGGEPASAGATSAERPLRQRAAEATSAQRMSQARAAREPSVGARAGRKSFEGTRAAERRASRRPSSGAAGRQAAPRRKRKRGRS